MLAAIARFVPRGSVILAATTLGSYALGLVRDRIFAQTFGASTSLDSYNAAFLVPDFGFNLLVASGIAAAAVPIFIELNARSRRQAYVYVNSLMAAAAIVMVGMAIFTFVCAPILSSLVAPGLDGEGRRLVVRLMRVLSISPILFAISNTLGALLVAQKRFFFYGLSPLLYNVGIIGGALWLAPHFGILGVAYGTIIGACLHAVIRLIDALSMGWRWHMVHPLPRAELIKTGRLMLPKMFGHPVELVTFWVFTSLASLLPAGSISVLNFARNFQSVPVSLLGIAMATAVFPSLAEAALGQRGQLAFLFRRTALVIFWVSALAALCTFLIRRPLVGILLGGGAFDAEAVARTALVLGVFCLSIPTESLSHLFARAFYAVQNTITPVTFSLLSLLAAASSAYILSSRLGIVGLPLGFFLGSLVKTVGLGVLFWRRSALNATLRQ